MAATGYTRSGAMLFHPYYHAQQAMPIVAQPKFKLPKGLQERLVDLVQTEKGGSWVHNPQYSAMRAFKAGNLALTIGQGNLMTRNFRQKPIVTLQKAEHKKLVKSKQPIKVDIPTVSSRRTKNNMLSTSTSKMAYRKRYSKSTKRPRYVKRRFKRKAMRKRIPTLWPRTKLVKMRMVFPGTLTLTSGAFNLSTIKANSLNDPTGAIGVQLPLGLDQWANIYTKYFVVGSKARFTLTTSSVATPGAVQIGIALKDDATSLADTNYYREYGRASIKMTTTQSDKIVLKAHYNGKKYEKINKWEDNDEFQGTFSGTGTTVTVTDPTTVRYYHLFGQDVSGAHTATIEYVAEIDYYVLLTDAIIPTRSSL